MTQRTQYKTKQMAQLLAYLQSVQGQHVTVNDICAHLKQQGAAVGTATVYRHLERMVEQGVVVQYTLDGASGACFEYLGERAQCHKPTCFHCKCERCGKLIHVHCEELEALEQHMLTQHGFAMDTLRTVLYGVCEQCKAAL